MLSSFIYLSPSPQTVAITRLGVRQTRSFDWKIMRREHEMFLSPRGALCRSMPRGYVAYRLCEVSAHEISSDRPDLSLFGFSVFRPSRLPGFSPFGLSAFRLFGLSAFRLSGDGAGSAVGWRAHLAVTLNPV